MKLEAIAGRGTKRDFVDCYVIAQQIPLKELLVFFEQKYSGLQYNMMHVYKSLVYFDDADGDPMPEMRTSVPWEDIKRFFRNAR